MTSTADAIAATADQTDALAFAPPPTVEPSAESAPKVVETTVPANGPIGVIGQQQPSGIAPNPLRLIEIILGALVVILAAATLIVRQRARG